MGPRHDDAERHLTEVERLVTGARPRPVEGDHPGKPLDAELRGLPDRPQEINNTGPIAKGDAAPRPVWGKAKPPPEAT